MLKKVCIVAIAALLQSSLAFAQGVLFQDIPWAEALRKAKAEGKGIFVDVYTSWCGPCRKMSAEVFTDSTVAEYMNSRFVCLKVDAEKKPGHDAIKDTPPSAYPSFYWYSADGKLKSIKSGYHPATEFIALNEDALKDDVSKAYDDACRLWDEGNRSPAFVKKFLQQTGELKPDSVRPLFNRYLEELNDPQLASKETGELVTWFMRSIKDDLTWRAMLVNDTTYLRYFGEDFARRLYTTLVRIPAIDRKRSEQLYKEDMRCIESYDYPLKSMFARLRDMEALLAKRNYSGAIASALAIGKEYEDVYPFVYTNAFYSLVINEFFVDAYTPSQAECDAALSLAKAAFGSTPSQCTLVYLAAAYARKGDYKEAYKTLASLPFHKEPTLSNAVYSLLNLKTLRRL